jgi:hypothetical protein
MDSPMKGSFKATDADLNGKQFYAVYISATAMVVDFSTAATSLSIGILNNNPKAAAGAVCEVVMWGFCKAKLGGSVTAGQWLVPTSDGSLVAVSLGTTTANVAVCRALISGSTNDIIPVFVCPHYIQV